MQRFYSNIQPSDTIRISVSDREELYHQMTRVLRMQKGDSCIFFGGDDVDHEYEITLIDKRTVELRRVASIVKTEPENQRVVLFQSLPNKLEKLEYVLQKGVEVGVDEFVFFESERSQKLPLLERKKDRMLQIAVEAVEQSWGNRVPEISFLKNLDEALARLKGIADARMLVTHTDGQGKKLREAIVEKFGTAAVFVGPEGGFSPAEVARFADMGATFLDLGNRILRTETAGVVTAFAVKQG